MLDNFAVCHHDNYVGVQVITRIGDPAEVGMKNGTGFQAEFVDLKALCVSRNSRYLYLIDSFAVRRVKLTGRAPTVTTVCGQVDFQGFADGDVDECLFFNPTCIAEVRLVDFLLR